MQEVIDRLKLSNGTRVLLIPRDESRSVMVLAGYGVGSLDETDALAGAAHYSEHMMFRGTHRYPDQTTLTTAIDSVGANFNAYTGKEMTAYYLHLRAERLPFAIEMVSELVLHPLFRAEDIDSERGAILQEARKSLDQPERRCDYLLQELAFPGHALGRPILGTLETIGAFDRDSLLGFREEYYSPDTAVITLAGKFDRSEAAYLLEQAFGQTPYRSVKRSRQGMTFQRGPCASFLAKPTAEEATLSLGFRSYDRDDARQPALTVLLNILGGTMSSRLMQTLRTKHGLTYGVSASSEDFQCGGVTTIDTSVERDCADQAVDLIIDELCQIKEHGVTDKELSGAKENLAGNVTLDFESLPVLGQSYLSEELLALRFRTIDEELAAIALVRSEQVQVVALHLFRTSRAYLAMIAREGDEDKMRRQLERLGE